MEEVISERLAALGCVVGDGDAELIAFCMRKVENYIKNFTNLPAVPEGLFEVFADRVCGEVLLSKLRSGELGGGALGIKSIVEGDVSVTFSGAEEVPEVIERLLNSGGGELICYRKIRW